MYSLYILQSNCIDNIVVRVVFVINVVVSTILMLIVHNVYIEVLKYIGKIGRKHAFGQSQT